MRLLVLAMAVSFLSACSTGDFYSAASGTVTQAQITSKLSDITNAAKTTFTEPAQLPSVGGLRRRAVREEDGSGFWDSCSTRTPNPTVDADSDDIPAERRVFYNCKDATIAGHTGLTFDLTGNFLGRDADDSKAGAGYHFEYNNIVGGHESTNGSSESYSYNGMWEMTGNETSWAYNSNFQGESSNVEVARAAGTYVARYGSTWRHTLTVDDAADPGKSGSITMNGFFGYHVADSATPTNNMDYVISIASTNLKYKRDSCSSYYESGSYEFTDGAGNKILFEFASCARTCKYNGVTFSC